MLHSDRALFGHQARRPGAIDRADVEVIRRLVYGRGGQSGLAISRTEAEFLFALERATAGAANDPAWRELFVKAITMHLLYGGASPDGVDEEEAAWLARRSAPAPGLTPTSVRCWPISSRRRRGSTLRWSRCTRAWGPERAAAAPRSRRRRRPNVTTGTPAIGRSRAPERQLRADRNRFVAFAFAGGSLLLELDAARPGPLGAGRRRQPDRPRPGGS